MQQLFQWIGSKGAWNCSRFSDLPQIRHDQRSGAHHWCVVAGGLALILSRSSDTQRSANFTATEALYEMLRDALRQGRRPRADAALVGDVMHEVAEVADPMTHASMGACFRECLKSDKTAVDSRIPAVSAMGVSTTAAAWPAFSRLVASSRMPAPSRISASSRISGSSRVSTSSPDLDDAPTVIPSELLDQRSHALRRTVAHARTNFAELR